jgi:hypothetical protein
LFQGTILHIALLGTNPTQNQLILFCLVCFLGIVFAALERLCFSFVLLLPLPLLLLLILGVLNVTRTYLGFTSKVQQFFHCSDGCCKSLHVMSSQLTLCPGL